MSISNGFSRSIRLTKPSEYSSIFAFKRLVRVPHFSVFAKPNQSIGRLGIAISKRVASRSVDRNYMKRVIREIFRLNKTGFIGFDWVVQARTKFHNGSYDSIQEELLNAVRQMCARKN